MLDPVNSSALHMQLTCFLFRREEVEAIGNWGNDYTIHVKELSQGVKSFLEATFDTFKQKNPLLTYTVSCEESDKDFLDIGPVS